MREGPSARKGPRNTPGLRRRYPHWPSVGDSNCPEGAPLQLVLQTGPGQSTRLPACSQPGVRIPPQDLGSGASPSHGSALGSSTLSCPECSPHLTACLPAAGFPDAASSACGVPPSSPRLPETTAHPSHLHVNQCLPTEGAPDSPAGVRGPPSMLPSWTGGHRAWSTRKAWRNFGRDTKGASMSDTMSMMF